MRSLSFRWVWSLGALALALFGLAACGCWWFTRDLLKRELEIGEAYEDLVLRERALYLARAIQGERRAANWYQAHGSPEFSAWLTRSVAALNPRIVVEVQDVQGRMIARAPQQAEPIVVDDAVRAQALRSEHVVTVIGDPAGRPLRAAVCVFARARGDLKPAGFVVAALPVSDADRQLRRLAWGLGAGAMLGTALMAIAAWAVIQPWSRLVAGFSTTARRIASDRFPSERLPIPEREPDLAQLARLVNAILDCQSAVNEAQRRFVADAAHELGTPLGILRGEIELALRRERTAGEYRATLESNREEIERLGRLIEQLLTLAAADGGKLFAEREPLSLRDLAQEVAERLEAGAAAAGVALEMRDEGAQKVVGNYEALVRVALNLARNAIQHSPAGESVTLRVGSDGHHARLEVTDAGEGIAPEHLPRVFERFYRVDTARSRASGGAGLGLAIVKNIVEAHGGNVSITSRLGHGTTVVVSLPVAGTGPDTATPHAEETKDTVGSASARDHAISDDSRTTRR
jgi:signal transduction histidine kinase